MLEIELRLRRGSNIEDIFNKLCAQMKPQLIQSIVLIGDKTRAEFTVVDGAVQASEKIIKKIVSREKLQFGKLEFNFVKANEEPTDRTEKYNSTRIKKRYRFDLGKWYCDITFVQTFEHPNPSIIRRERQKFFEDSKHSGSTLELELEYKIPDKFVDSDIKEIVAQLFGSSPFMRVREILRSSGNTLKNILPNAIELTKRTFIEKVYPCMDEFYVVDKADGERMILYVNGTADLITAEKKIHVDGEPTFKESIFECEVVGDKIYIYDIIMLDGEILVEKTFKERWRPQFDISSLKNVYFKNYTDAINIKEVLERKLEYETDGVIFSIVNKPYAMMSHYKWKPIDKMSIDFLCMRDENDTYNLFCTISDRDFKNLRLQHLSNHKKLFKNRGAERSFPVHFCPSSAPMAYIYKSEEDLHDKIVEFGYEEAKNSVGHKVPSLRLMRIRHDREEDKKAGYSGNYFRIAELIWNNFSDPLTLDMILDPKLIVDNMYFQKNSDEWREIRSHNNAIKRKYIEKYSNNCNWVLDFACGMGQDIRKYMTANVKNLIMVDSVADNISQVITRKYDMIKMQMPRIYTFCIDLTQDADMTFNEIMTNGLPLDGKKIDFIVCNLAIHYLIPDEASLDNTIRMFSRFAEKGTKIMITSLDGGKLFNFLDKDYISADKKFIIRKLWKDNKLAKVGQRISIKLPFALEEREETIVNYDEITKRFKKFDIEKLDSGSFDENTKFNLSEDEKKYVGLHSWYIYCKK